MRWIAVICSVLVAAALPAGCGGLQPEVLTLNQAAGEKVVAMKASSFAFEPNNLKAYTNDTLVFRIESVSGIGHNFTVTDPAGETVKDVALPPGTTTEVRLELSQSGIYHFYCDKPLHKSLGMRGQVSVSEK